MGRLAELAGNQIADFQGLIWICRTSLWPLEYYASVDVGDSKIRPAKDLKGHFRPQVSGEGELSVQINISARHGHLSLNTQAKINEKLEKLPRLFDRLTAIYVTADLEHKDSLNVELRVSAEHCDDFIATDTSGDLMSALDRVMRKIETQLRKHKEKLTGRRTTGLKHLEVPADTETEMP